MVPRISLARVLQELRRVWRGRSRAGRRAPGKSDVASLLAQIHAARAGLGEFGQVSDREFSALAQGLARLNTRLADLQAQTGTLTAALEDRDEDHAIASAYALYKDSVDLVHANAGIAVSAQEQLTQVEAALMQSCQGQGTFARDHMFLRIVTLGIRIEVSRLPAEEQAVFLNVASAITETGERIHTCTAQAFGRIEAVIAESSAARGALSSTEEMLQQRARNSIETLQKELTALQTALAPCAGHSRAIADLLAVARPQTLGVIAALQHQDIVRQQLEHVSEGFQDLDEHLRAAVAPAGTAGQQEEIEWDYVHHAARIQAGQLAASRREIEHAGTAVVGGLQSLLATSASMLERFSDMEGAAALALDDCHITDLFAKELQSLTAVVERSQQANARTDHLVERIGEVVRVFSEEINRYELDVKIVALNAQIAAAHLPSGNALSKLAEETSAVSDRNAGLTRQLSTELLSSLEKLDNLKREGAEFLAIVSKEKANLESGLATVVAKLGRLVQRVRVGSLNAHSEFAPVHSDCEGLLGTLGFPAQIEATFTPATQLCADLAAAHPTAVSIAAASESAQSKIQQHRNRYTMEKEEATHAAALDRPRTADPAAAAATLATTSAADDDIELFDLTPDSAPAAANGTSTSEPSAPAGPAPQTPAATEPPPPAKDKFGDGIELF